MFLFLMLGFIGLFRQVAWELDRIERKVSAASSIELSSSGLASVLQLVTPFPNQKLRDRVHNIERIVYRDWGWYGCFDWVKHVGLDRGSSGIGIELASQMPFVQSMAISEGCPITDAQLRAFNPRCLQYLSIEHANQLSAGAFRGVDFSMLETLVLAGENIDDDVLASIGPTPKLLSLSLVNTSVTTEGLKQFATVTRPLVRLELKHTPLTDEVFAVLPTFANLNWIDLTGTDIDGSGLKQLRGNCHHLILSDTRLDWSYLAELLPAAGKKTTSNGFALSQLTLRNTVYQPEALDVLKELSTHLWRLDVGSHALPDEIFENPKLNLSQCTLDGMSVDPENIQLYGSVHLALYFDARVTSPAEIVSHFHAIVDAQFEELEQTARQMRLPAPTQRKGNVSVIVDQLELTDEALTVLEPIEQDHHLEFVNARGPDKKVVFTYGVRHARALYPRLADPRQGQ